MLLTVCSASNTNFVAVLSFVFFTLSLSSQQKPVLTEIAAEDLFFEVLKQNYHKTTTLCMCILFSPFQFTGTYLCVFRTVVSLMVSVATPLLCFNRKNGTFHLVL